MSSDTARADRTEQQRQDIFDLDAAPRGRSKLISALTLLVFIVFTAAVFWFIGRPVLRFVSKPALFRNWVESHGVWGKLAFIGMMALQIIVAVIPGEPLEIGSGYAFGVWEGTLLCLIGAAAGSTAVYLFTKKLGVKIIAAFFPIEKIRRFKFIQNHRKLNAMVFILFFIPGTPKDILTYFIGLTPMKLKTWLFITCTARIPSVVTSTISGNALSTQNYRFAAVMFAVTVLLSLSGVFIYRKMAKPEAEEKTD